MSDDDPAGVSARRSVRLPGITASIAEARSVATGAAGDLGLPQPMLDRIELLVSELATNAVEASPGRDFLVDTWYDGDSLTVAVTNPASPADIPDRAQWTANNALEARGRGLGIVDHLADRVDLELSDEQVIITATVQVRAEPNR